MGKGYAEGSAVEERLAALERGRRPRRTARRRPRRRLRRDRRRAGAALHRLAGRCRSGRAVRLGRGVGDPDRPSRGEALADDERCARLARHRARIDLRHQPDVDSASRGRRRAAPAADAGGAARLRASACLRDLLTIAGRPPKDRASGSLADPRSARRGWDCGSCGSSGVDGGLRAHSGAHRVLRAPFACLPPPRCSCLPSPRARSPHRLRTRRSPT